MPEYAPPRKKFGGLRPQNEVRVVPQSTDDPWVRRAREAFDASTTFLDANYRKDLDASLAHFRNAHMPGSKYYSDAYKWRSKIFRPKTRAHIRQAEAAAASAFFSQLDVISFEPADDDDPLQLASAALRQEIINHRLTGTDQIPWFQTCVGAFQETHVTGVTISKQFWDYAERETEMPIIVDGQQALDESGKPAVARMTVKVRDRPDIKLYPIENVRFDPAAEWTDVVNTSPYFIGLDSMRIGDVRERMRRGEWIPLDDSVLLGARNAAYDSTRIARTGERDDEKDPRYGKALADYDLVWVHENFMRLGDEEYHYYTLGTLALLTQPRPLKLAYLHNRRPFVVGSCMIEPHKAIPDSPAHLAKTMQKEANEIANTRLDNVKLVLNKRYFAKRGKQIDLESLVRNAPASVTLMNDPASDVVPQEFSDVTSSSYAEQDRVNVDMDELLGSFSAGSIATNRKLGETVGGLAMLRGTSNTMGQYTLRVFAETWVEKVLHQLDELEQHYESDEEFLSLMARRANIGKYGVTTVTAELLMAPAKLSVNVANSAMDPTVRLELFAFAMRMYAEFRQIMPPDIDPEPVKGYLFGLLGFRDASRFSVDADGQNPQMVAAQQQIAQLQQALEGKMLEIQAANEAKFAAVEARTAEAAAKIEMEMRKASAEFLQRERESLREAEVRLETAAREERMRAAIAKLQEDTKLLIAQMNRDTQLAISQNSEETKRFAAALQDDTKAMLAGMQQSGVQNDGLERMDAVLEKIATGLVQNGEALEEALKTLSGPQETEIVERDEEGLPRKSRTRKI